MLTSHDDEEITGINVTPLVDVMLVLLVIFMVTASYIIHRSIAVNLPKAQTAEQKISSKSLAFVLDKEANLYLDGKKLSYNQLSSQIEMIKKNLLKQNNLKLQALITADKSTPHGKVIELIDQVRQNGIASFAINVEAIVDKNPK